MPLATPISLEAVFVDPDEVVSDVVARAPYWNQARYVPGGRTATAPRGHPLARTDGSAPPVFRSDWAYVDPLIEGIDDKLHHPELRAAAARLFGGQVVVPYVLHVNLTAPGPAIDAGHTDVPAFRGLDRRHAPGWLLLAMARSGHFERWYVSAATSVAWLYRGRGGGFTFWPDGPDRSATTIHDLWNTALVADNDHMFHRVEDVGPPDAPDLRLSADSQLIHVGQQRFEIVDEGTVLADLHVSDLRISLSWKAMVFSDDADHQRFASHRDDLDIETVRVKLVDEVRRLGFPIASDTPIDDSAFIEAVSAAYPRSVPSATA